MPCTGPSTYCKLLNDSIEAEANAHRKGFVQIVATNVNTHEDRVIGVAFKRSSRDRGVMINHCPWCGADLTAGFTHDGRSEQEQRPEVEDLGPLELPGDVEALLGGAVGQAERDVVPRQVEGV